MAKLPRVTTCCGCCDLIVPCIILASIRLAASLCMCISGILTLLTYIGHELVGEYYGAFLLQMGVVIFSIVLIVYSYNFVQGAVTVSQNILYLI